MGYVGFDFLVEPAFLGYKRFHLIYFGVWSVGVGRNGFNLILLGCQRYHRFFHTVEPVRVGSLEFHPVDLGIGAACMGSER